MQCLTCPLFYDLCAAAAVAACGQRGLSGGALPHQTFNVTSLDQSLPLSMVQFHFPQNFQRWCAKIWFVISPKFEISNAKEWEVHDYLDHEFALPYTTKTPTTAAYPRAG